MKNSKEMKAVVIEGEHATEVRDAAYKYLVELYRKDMQTKERPQ